MNEENFLHISKLACNDLTCNLDELKALYKSPTLIKYVSELIWENIKRDQIKDKNVLLKPNWVYHSTRPSDDFCMRTNDSFLLAVLDVIVEMKPSSIIIGDAPVQGCKWERMISFDFEDRIHTLSTKSNIPIQIRDFRRRTYNLKDNTPRSDLTPLSDYVIFDLGKKSYLEPITLPGPSRFRVTNYDPDRMNSAHSPGIHRYCITKEFFGADTVISLPKLKIHQKTGITAGLKNLVGINGDKDFLPHHRLGGTKRGGDCYPGGSFLRYWAELALDNANRHQGKYLFWIWQKVASLLWLLSLPGPEHHIAAGWYGNDTTWRMVMDLNMIAYFGLSDGTMAKTKQRNLYTIGDCIIAGQGNGPLEPEPLPLGLITIANNPAMHDIAMASIIGLQYKKIPLLTEAIKLFGNNGKITLNGRLINIQDLDRVKTIANLPPGWKSYCI